MGVAEQFDGTATSSDGGSRSGNSSLVAVWSSAEVVGAAGAARAAGSEEVEEPPAAKDALLITTPPPTSQELLLAALIEQLRLELRLKDQQVRGGGSTAWTHNTCVLAARTHNKTRGVYACRPAGWRSAWTP